jgi:hypothetical protein
MSNEDLTEKMPFDQRQKGHGHTWARDFRTERTADISGPKEERYLACSNNEKEATVPGAG